jgi:hypothetical protein
LCSSHKVAAEQNGGDEEKGEVFHFYTFMLLLYTFKELVKIG